MNNYLCYYRTEQIEFCELFHQVEEVETAMAGLTLVEIRVVEQRACEPWASFCSRCKQQCGRLMNDARRLNRLLGLNFFCSREFDGEVGAALLSIPENDDWRCDMNCNVCALSDQEKKRRLLAARRYYLHVHKSDFPPQTYYVPVSEMPSEPPTEAWTLTLFNNRCVLVCESKLYQIINSEQYTTETQ